MFELKVVYQVMPLQEINYSFSEDTGYQSYLSSYRQASTTYPRQHTDDVNQVSREEKKSLPELRPGSSYLVTGHSTRVNIAGY